MDTTLLIMAAGIGSRFGTGIKQLAMIDEDNHIIMDYSVHDAIAAGFNRIVFIIRREIEAEFRAVIGDRMETVCKAYNVKMAYAYQDIRQIPASLPEGRTKPWGTGHAILSAKSLIETPFAVINADDYYGKKAYRLVHDFLCTHTDESCMAGFELRNTLSDHGGVTRGICQMKNGYLTHVAETRNVTKTVSGAEADGKAIDGNALVSMNMWGLPQSFLSQLEEGFEVFFAEQVPSDPMKAEFLVPVFIGEQLQKKAMSVRVLKTEDAWLGMTYQQDVAPVREHFRQMIAQGIYQADLYADL